MTPARVGDLAVEDLVAAYGSPLYAYDAAVVRHRHARIAELFAGLNGSMYYSLKANPVLGLVRFLRLLGVRADACSPGDLRLAARAGFAPEDVGFVGVSLSADDVTAAAEAGCTFTADSIEQLRRYAAYPGRRRSDVGLRLNPDVAAGFHPHVQAGAWVSKFGLHPQQLRDALDEAAGLGLTVTGVHAHIGSDILEAAPHLQVLCRLLELTRDVSELEWVNIGGGFGTPFLAGDAEYPVAELREGAYELLDAEMSRRGRSLELRIEPGAYLLMDAGVLLTRITELKPPVERDGRRTPRFAGVDSSFNHVVSAVLYGTQHPVQLGRDVYAPAGVETTVVGNLMQAGDVLARDRPLPADLRVDDVLVVRKTGAYSSSRSTVFNGRPRPAEVLVDGSDVRLLRRRETPDDLLTLDLDLDLDDEREA